MYNYNQPPYGYVTPSDYLNQVRTQQQSQQQAQPQQSNAMIWVQGEAGAKSYLVAPNTTLMLLDSENPVFYIKRTDASGMPFPLRIFDYKERIGNPPQTPNFAPQQENAFDPNNYITRTEFEQAIKALTQQSITQTEVTNDGK